MKIRTAFLVFSVFFVHLNASLVIKTCSVDGVDYILEHKNEFNFFEPILMKITIFNRNKESFRFSSTNKAEDIIFIILDQNNIKPELTKIGKIFYENKNIQGLNRNKQRTLFKGDKFLYELDLKEFFDLKENGHYRLTTRFRHLYFDQANNELKTNFINLPESLFSIKRTEP